MSTEAIEKDHFWFYIIGLTIVLVTVVGMVKLSENEKYDPIQKQLSEESRSMNIRVIKEY